MGERESGGRRIEIRGDGAHKVGAQARGGNWTYQTEYALPVVEMAWNNVLHLWVAQTGVERVFMFVLGVPEIQIKPRKFRR